MICEGVFQSAESVVCSVLSERDTHAIQTKGEYTMCVRVWHKATSVLCIISEHHPLSTPYSHAAATNNTHHTCTHIDVCLYVCVREFSGSSCVSPLLAVWCMKSVVELTLACTVQLKHFWHTRCSHIRMCNLHTYQTTRFCSHISGTHSPVELAHILWGQTKRYTHASHHPHRRAPMSAEHILHTLNTRTTCRSRASHKIRISRRRAHFSTGTQNP